MQPVLIVGNAVLDIALGVTHYPQEDEEMRANSREARLGGNAANTARVLSGLGREAALLATLAPDADGTELHSLLDAAGVNVEYLVTANDGHTPVSYILLHAANGSRTIVHHRDLAELSLADFQALPLSRFGWIHFEGRNVAEVKRMLMHLRDTGFAGHISVEIEKDRPQIEELMPYADLLMFSRAFAEARGHTDAPALLAAMHVLAPQAEMSCTWGEAGAWALDRDGSLHHCPAFKPERVVDTIGAGDVFNAGMITAMAKDHNLLAALNFATQLAGHKVGLQGMTGLHPNAPSDLIKP